MVGLYLISSIYMVDCSALTDVERLSVESKGYTSELRKSSRKVKERPLCR